MLVFLSFSEGTNDNHEGSVTLFCCLEAWGMNFLRVLPLVKRERNSFTSVGLLPSRGSPMKCSCQKLRGVASVPEKPPHLSERCLLYSTLMSDAFCSSITQT